MIRCWALPCVNAIASPHSSGPSAQHCTINQCASDVCFGFYGPQLFSFDSLSPLWSAVFRGSPSALPAQSETVEHLAAMEADVSLRSRWSLTKADSEGALDQIAVNIAHKCWFIISVCAPKWPIKVTGLVQTSSLSFVSSYLLYLQAASLPSQPRSSEHLASQGCFCFFCSAA